MLSKGKFKEPDFVTRMIAEMHGAEVETKELEVGIYHAYLNADNDVVNMTEKYPDLVDSDGDLFSSYGVCDNYQQVIDQCPMVKEGASKYIVLLTTIEKADEPDSGGWRWHKWGSYIGDKNPQCEYLADEDDSIQVIQLYSIIQVS